jgi:elongin-C
MADEKSSQYVTLVSNDGYEFKILRSAACIAGTIKKALDPLCMFLIPMSTNNPEPDAENLR